MDHGVADDQPRLRIDRTTGIERAAIDQERLARGTMAGKNWSMMPQRMRRTRSRLLADKRQRRQIRWRCRRRQRGHSRPRLPARRRREARTEGHIASDEHVDAGQAMRARSASARRRDVVAPVFSGFGSFSSRSNSSVVVHQASRTRKRASERAPTAAKVASSKAAVGRNRHLVVCSPIRLTRPGAG